MRHYHLLGFMLMIPGIISVAFKLGEYLGLAILEIFFLLAAFDYLRYHYNEFKKPSGNEMDGKTSVTDPNHGAAVPASIVDDSRPSHRKKATSKKEAEA